MTTARGSYLKAGRHEIANVSRIRVFMAGETEPDGKIAADIQRAALALTVSGRLPGGWEEEEEKRSVCARWRSK